MYKFSRCHAVIFHDFFIQFTDFWQKSPIFLAKFVRKSPCPFLEKTGRFIGETGRISVFLVFIVHPSSTVHFGRIFLNFTDFFSKTDGIGESLTEHF
jgi:hypothetical protein